MSFGHKVDAQRGHGAAQMRLDRARRDAKHLRGAVGVKVQEKAQGNNLPLPGGQPHQCGHDSRIDGAVSAPIGCGWVRNRAGIGDRYLTAVAPPPGDIRIQRGTDHPRYRYRMPANCAPRGPCPGKGLGDKLLCRVPVTDTYQDGEEAFILGSVVELREVLSVGAHTRSTHNCPAAVTWLVPVASDRAVSRGEQRSLPDKLTRPPTWDQAAEAAETTS